MLEAQYFSEAITSRPPIELSPVNLDADSVISPEAIRLFYATGKVPDGLIHNPLRTDGFTRTIAFNGGGYTYFFTGFFLGIEQRDGRTLYRLPDPEVPVEKLYEQLRFRTNRPGIGKGLTITRDGRTFERTSPDMYGCINQHRVEEKIKKTEMARQILQPINEVSIPRFLYQFRTANPDVAGYVSSLPEVISPIDITDPQAILLITNLCARAMHELHRQRYTHGQVTLGNMFSTTIRTFCLTDFSTLEYVGDHQTHFSMPNANNPYSLSPMALALLYDLHKPLFRIFDLSVQNTPNLDLAEIAVSFADGYQERLSPPVMQKVQAMAAGPDKDLNKLSALAETVTRNLVTQLLKPARALKPRANR